MVQLWNVLFLAMNRFYDCNDTQENITWKIEVTYGFLRGNLGCCVSLAVNDKTWNRESFETRIIRISTEGNLELHLYIAFRMYQIKSHCLLRDEKAVAFLSAHLSSIRSCKALYRLRYTFPIWYQLWMAFKLKSFHCCVTSFLDEMKITIVFFLGRYAFSAF